MSTNGMMQSAPQQDSTQQPSQNPYDNTSNPVLNQVQVQNSAPNSRLPRATQPDVSIPAAEEMIRQQAGQAWMQTNQSINNVAPLANAEPGYIKQNMANYNAFQDSLGQLTSAAQDSYGTITDANERLMQISQMPFSKVVGKISHLIGYSDYDPEYQRARISTTSQNLQAQSEVTKFLAQRAASSASQIELSQNAAQFSDTQRQQMAQQAERVGTTLASLDTANYQQKQRILASMSVGDLRALKADGVLKQNYGVGDGDIDTAIANQTIKGNQATDSALTVAQGQIALEQARYKLGMQKIDGLTPQEVDAALADPTKMADLAKFGIGKQQLIAQRTGAQQLQIGLALYGQQYDNAKTSGDMSQLQLSTAMIEATLHRAGTDRMEKWLAQAKASPDGFVNVDPTEFNVENKSGVKLHLSASELQTQLQGAKAALTKSAADSSQANADMQGATAQHQANSSRYAKIVQTMPSAMDHGEAQQLQQNGALINQLLASGDANSQATAAKMIEQQRKQLDAINEKGMAIIPEEQRPGMIEWQNSGQMTPDNASSMLASNMKNQSGTGYYGYFKPAYDALAAAYGTQVDHSLSLAGGLITSGSNPNDTNNKTGGVGSIPRFQMKPADNFEKMVKDDEVGRQLVRSLNLSMENYYLKGAVAELATDMPAYSGAVVPGLPAFKGFFDGHGHLLPAFLTADGTVDITKFLDATTRVDAATNSNYTGMVMSKLKDNEFRQHYSDEFNKHYDTPIDAAIRARFFGNRTYSVLDNVTAPRVAAVRQRQQVEKQNDTDMQNTFNRDPLTGIPYIKSWNDGSLDPIIGKPGIPQGRFDLTPDPRAYKPLSGR